MRGDYEAKNDRHPFQVQFIGLNEIGVRNLSTDEILVRETKKLGEPYAKEQYDRLDTLALRAAQERRREAITGADPGVTHETPQQTAERLAARH